MKKLYFVYSLIFLMSCSTNDQKYQSFGAEVSNSQDVTIDELIASVNENEATFKVKGIVEEVCQMKGCWMTLKNDKGASIRITFKDYGFFVPKDISGREVILEGVAFKEKLAEDVAKHYADDGGLEYNEEMRNQISFIAKGVLVAEN
jgi:hypothetical protein